MAKDKLHEAVVNSLKKDGWTITHDPLVLKDKTEKMRYDIDIAAEK